MISKEFQERCLSLLNTDLELNFSIFFRQCFLFKSGSSILYVNNRREGKCMPMPGVSWSIASEGRGLNQKFT